MSNTSTFARSPIANTSFVDLVSVVHQKWASGWLPRDLIRLAETIDRPLLVELMVDLIAADRAGWHEDAAAVWNEHGDFLGATVWWNSTLDYWQQLIARTGPAVEDVELLATYANALLSMPTRDLPQFEPPPWEPGLEQPDTAGIGQERALTKIRALLAKAESTDYPEEAELLSAKAQELIARYSIDIAMLAETCDVPGGRRVYVESPYAKPKFFLLAEVAEANDCQVVWNNNLKTATLLGHRADMDLVDLLFTSLLVQGTGAVLAAGSKSQYGQSTTRSWRNAFWAGYAGRIGERLLEASLRTRGEAVEQHRDLLPVLAGRSEAVERAVAEAFPNLGSLRLSSSNFEGHTAGRQFADRATLNSNPLAKSQVALSGY